MDLIMLTHTLDNRSTEIIYYDYPSYREAVWCDAQMLLDGGCAVTIEMTQPDPDPLTIPDLLRRDKRLPRAAIEALTSSSIDWAPIRKIESYQKDDVPAIFVENRKAPVQVNLCSKPNAKKRGAKRIAEYPSFDAFLKAHDFQRYPVSQTFVLSNEDISIVAVLDRWPSKAKRGGLDG